MIEKVDTTGKVGKALHTELERQHALPLCPELGTLMVERDDGRMFCLDEDDALGQLTGAPPKRRPKK